MSVDELRERVNRLMPRAREDLARMVSLKSVYDPRTSPDEDCQRMVDLTIELFAGAGLRDVQAHETSDGSMTVCGHTPGPRGAPTVLLYFHHDVQPPLDERAWDSPVWELTDRNGRWYGRGAADCKGNIVTHLTALRALGDEWPVGVKIVGEGSEELGDGGLEEFVPGHADLLRADVILICDSGNSAAGTPTLTSTLRGVVEVVVTVRTLDDCDAFGHVRGRRPGRTRCVDPDAGDAARRPWQHDDTRARQLAEVDRRKVPARGIPRPRTRPGGTSTCWETTSPTWCGRGRLSVCWVSIAQL